MTKIKVSISNLEGKVQNLEIEGSQAQQFIGRKLGDVFEGSILGLKDKLQITGGSDKDGFPMRSDIMGGVRKSVLLSKGVGFNSKIKGERRRRSVRGNTITDDIVQLNLKIIKK